MFVSLRGANHIDIKIEKKTWLNISYIVIKDSYEIQKSLFSEDMVFIPSFDTFT